MIKSPPIAIVGRALLVPGAHSPEELWEKLIRKESLISSVPKDRWGMRHEDVLCEPDANSDDRTWSDRGGYVRGFEEIFDPEGFAISSDEILSLDPLFQWTFHTAREALRDAGYQNKNASRFGAVFGNLSFPSAGMAGFTQATAIKSLSGYGEEALKAAGIETPAAANRFNSGLPALMLERALGLGKKAFALDAACASSLYAIKLACDQLQDGTTDLMLAGAVNCADDLCIHLGFSALKALSKTGQSRPFNKDADGLVPAEGCGFVVLRRLEDALADGDTIYGVIRGVGLSNDGRGRGMLVPSREGQARAISKAFDCAGLTPSDISLLECHATGTQVGDTTEIKSSADIYGKRGHESSKLPIGSLKSNTGHLITAAGVAGLIKVLEAMKHETLPPTLNSDSPLDEIDDSPFRLLTQSEPWDRDATSDGILRAGISAFGFGGNNAHLIVEEASNAQAILASYISQSSQKKQEDQIVIVGVGINAASATGRDAFGRALTNNSPCLDENGEGRMDDISLKLKGLKFPPNDLKKTLSQQLALLNVAEEALENVALPKESTGVYIGMGTDPEAARFGVRWRLTSAGQKWGCTPEWIATAKDSVGPVLDAAGVMGTMPNIVANRLNSQFDLGGASFTVSAEEHSGLVALDVATRALRKGEIDAALVGAVDFSCNQTHQAAAKICLDPDRQIPGDAAVVLVLKRKAEAQKSNDTIYAILPEPLKSEEIHPDLQLGLGSELVNLNSLFGHAHAASALVHVAAAVHFLHHRTLLGGRPFLASNYGSGSGLAKGEGPRTIRVKVKAMGAITRQILLAEAKEQLAPSTLLVLPQIYIFSAKTTQELLDKMHKRETDRLGDPPGKVCLVVVASNNEEREERLNKARRHIEDGHPPGRGVHFRLKPIVGEMAFVFTAAGAAYRDMGEELLCQMPELITPISECFPIGEVSGWVYEDTDSSSALVPGPSDYLWGTSMLTQAHVHLTRHILNLKPSAAIGYSSGESNSLYAFDVWSDMDAMRREIDESGMMEHELGVNFAAIARAWETDSVEWSVWNILAPLSEVQNVVDTHHRVHIAIINTSTDIIIGGDRKSCDAVVEKIGRKRCLPVGYNLACHVPEVGQSFHKPWIDIHTRKVTPAKGIRHYSNGVGGAYEVGEDACAKTITAQAETTLDFPTTIQSAFDDGVRIFIEHGPAGACTKFISEILKGQDDTLCIQLDRRDKNIEQIFEVVAALVAAGIAVDHGALTERLKLEPSQDPDSQPSLRFSSHPDRIVLPPRVFRNQGSQKQIVSEGKVTRMTNPKVYTLPEFQSPILPNPTFSEVAPREPFGLSASPIMTANELIEKQLSAMTAMHQTFIEQQAAIHNQFLSTRSGHQSEVVTIGLNSAAELPLPVGQVVQQNESVNKITNFTNREATKPSPTLVPQGQKASLLGGDIPTGPVEQIESTTTEIVFKPVGPKWNKEQLKIHSSGKISQLFGPIFESQDGYDLQCRMPEPPLLLADRVTGIEAKPGVLGRGKIWTQTDVKDGDWYLNDGYMPAGFMIESGQADLMLISYMGIDLLNKGNRVYRLLGCTLTYHDDLAKVGETLEYEIRINGHAKHGDVRLFFFDYDCIVDGHRRLTVREGQAGFFSYHELADAMGILWTAEAGKKDLKPDAILDPPLVSCTKSSFSRQEVSAFSEGRLFDCFGPGYEWAQTHTRSPQIQSAEKLFIHEVSQYDPKGGPWGRGFMRCETAVKSDDWFFEGHFKNDPCMPGNFMVEACIQALSFYIAAGGHTLKKDGWRFQPLPEQPFELKCRGEINPQTKHVAYEIHVEEFRAGPHPSVICDVVGFVDGEAAFHAHQIGVELVPDWPLTTMQNIINDPSKKTPSGTIIAKDQNGFAFDWKAMISCAWGRPSEAFGSMYSVFDGVRQSPRLPGEPYHFISRIVKIDGELDVCKAGMEIISEYDIPENAWYFDENGIETMPFAVLLEAALQPCGWVASAIGSVTKLEDDLMFRNLDGTGTVLQELTRTSGVLSTHVKVTNVSNAGGMVIESFEVECFIGDNKVYEMDTVFGFFPPEAFDNQAGLPIKEVDRNQRDAAGIFTDLKSAPKKYCSGSLRLADPMLLMIDRAMLIPNTGEAQLGILRGEKDVDISEWFFKAHFFQDPVQPGSLGIEALIQLLQFYMLETGMGEELGDEAYFEPLKLDAPLTWKYRGQVTPKNKLITSTMEITEVGTDDIGPFVIGKGSLWVDGLRIYEASNMGMRIVATKKKTTANDRVIFNPGDALSTIVRDFWNPVLGTPKGWLGEDIVLGLINQYVNRVIVNRKTLDRLEGKPAIYLGNHQVQIESLIVTNLIPALTGLPMTTLANAKHRTRWIGQLIDGLQSYPGFQAFEQIVYFEQNKPESMFEILAQMRNDMANGVRSFFVHTDGTRSQSCREKTRRCSSVFLDLALELDIPIVPFSFTGGLPIAPISGKAEVPFEHGRQDYWIGEPIEPETLRALTLRDRVDKVVSAINALGMTPQEDRPLISDKAFAKNVNHSRKETGVHEIFVSIWKVLENTKKKNKETTCLLEMMNPDGSNPQIVDNKLLSAPVIQWLDQMSRLFMRSSSQPPILKSKNVSNLTIRLSDYPYLVDHAIDGRNIIPVVLVIEWFARILKEIGENCGMTLDRISNLQVLKGLDINNEIQVTINARTLDASQTQQRVILELSQVGTLRMNYRCEAVFGSALQKDVRPLVLVPPQKKKNLYGGVLFHGPSFQVLKSFAFTDTGCVATLIGVLAKDWKKTNPWSSDPALLDGALQMALLWTGKLLGGKSLPTKINEIHLFHPPTQGDFTATLTGYSATKNRVICDVIMQNQKGNIVAKLIGIETHRLPTNAR